MKIFKTNELTKEQQKEIEALEKACYEKEGLENHVFMSNEINYDREIPVFFLGYEGEKLIGFLTFFIPTKEEAEISAIVHPDYQRQGVFTALDEEARKVIAENNIGRILYSVETKSKSAAEVLKRWGISEILRSEYRMEINKNAVIHKDVPAKKDADFSVKRTVPENIGAYLEISNRAFGEEEDASYSDTIMNSETRMGYVFYRNEEPIGTFAIGLETKGEPFIYGVAISEKKRGRGYGRMLMEEACRIGGDYGKTLRLDVDSENPPAFNLYKSLGFEITFQVDYYKR